MCQCSFVLHKKNAEPSERRLCIVNHRLVWMCFGLVVDWEKMLVNAGSVGPVVNLPAGVVLWNWTQLRRPQETLRGFHKRHEDDARVNIPIPIPNLHFAPWLRMLRRTEWMDGSDGEAAEGFLPNDSCRLPASHCCQQANTGVIRGERLCNLRRTQRHFNKLEFVRRCRLCNTFSVMSFAYVYCSCHGGAGGSTENTQHTFGAAQQQFIYTQYIYADVL